MRKIFVLWLLLLSVVSLAQPYSVKQLGIEKGLSNNYVVSIAQDKQGFLWFATEEGLNQFRRSKQNTLEAKIQDFTLMKL